MAELERAADFYTIDNTNLQELQNAISSAEDFNSALDEAQLFAGKFTQNFSDLESFRSVSTRQDLVAVLNDFEANAEVLGIDPRTIQLFNDTEQQLEDLTVFQDEVDTFLSRYGNTIEAAITIENINI